MDFYDAYHYLKNLESVYYKGETYFDKCLYMTVVKVNPNTMEIDDNLDLNTKIQVWLEFGEVYFDKMFKCPMVTHDPDLDCGGDTYEEAIIELAELVQRKTYKNKQCEFCILDNIDGINTCTLYGKQAFDICISKDYIPNKNNCDRYKKNIINKEVR